MSKVIDYVNGVDRNNPDKVKSHIYALTKAGNYWPMCDYGWNRSGGERYSIFRGWTSKRGVCKVCTAAKANEARPIFQARAHKTRWL